MTATLTQSEIPISSGEITDAPSEREADPTNAQTAPIRVDIPITQRDRLEKWLRAAGTYLTPPSVLTDRPASVSELRAYAKQAGWTSSPTGAVRGAGIAWYRFVGLPTTVVCRYGEWIAQRPGRAITVFVLWKLGISSEAGLWVADNVITPAAHAAAWVLL